jgi:Tol biopolymer transport system component
VRTSRANRSFLASSRCVLRALATLAISASACGPRTRSDAPRPAQPRIAIIASERGPQGTHLVVLDELGDRQFDLLEPPDAIARDSHPAVSPDGAWLVFASSRERALDETSLWIAPLRSQSTPVRLTDGLGIESHPVWAADGKSVVFASTRDGGDFDLYSLPIADGHASGAPVALTSGAGHEVTPATLRDGTVLYAAITEAGTTVESHLEARAPDGTITHVTEGPADASPALSPDERTLVFARPVQHALGLDGELWTMPPANSDAAAPLIDLPLTDESGPVWSPDGRYLFATSVLRGASGNPVFSSVIVIDTRERPMHARMLVDRVGAIPRLTPALTRAHLDESALARNPEYLPELRRITAGAIAKQKLEGAP